MTILICSFGFLVGLLIGLGLGRSRRIELESENNNLNTLIFHFKEQNFNLRKQITLNTGSKKKQN